MNKGFTLIELLVVIVIIGIVSSFGVSAALRARLNAQDAQRQSDLRSVQAALSQYYADQHYYPAVLNWNGAMNELTNQSGSQICQPGQFCSRTITAPPTGSKTYMSALPKDPDPSSLPYAYFALPRTSSYICDDSPSHLCTGYCLFAELKNPPPVNAIPNLCTSSNPNFTNAPSNYNFAVTEP